MLKESYKSSGESIPFVSVSLRLSVGLPVCLFLIIVSTHLCCYTCGKCNKSLKRPIKNKQKPKPLLRKLSNVCGGKIFNIQEAMSVF